MKKLLSVALSALLCFFISCNSEKGGNDSIEKTNLAVSHIINKAFETGDASQIDSIVSPDFVDHSDRGNMNRDSLKLMIKWIHDTHKDMKTEIVREVADSDFVYSWMHWTGTGDGTGGMPSGPYDMVAMEVTRYKDGKAVEHWTFMEIQSMMKMMAQMPAGLPEMTMPDSAGKK